MFNLFLGKAEKNKFLYQIQVNLLKYIVKSKLLVIMLNFYTCISFYMYIKFHDFKARNQWTIFLFVDYQYILYSPNIPVLALLRLRKSAPLLTSRSGV